MTPTIKAVVMDIDGTLVGDDAVVPAVNIAAVGAAARRGTTFVLASGRMTACIEPFFDALGVDGLIMAYNGALLRAERREGRRALFHRPLPAPMVSELISFARANRYQLNLYVDDVLYGQDDPALEPYWRIYANQTRAIYHFTDLDRLRGSEASKAIIITAPDERERLYRHFEPLVAGRATLIRTNPEYLEFTAPGVDKGTGLDVLASHLGIGLESIAALGDGDNDLPMILRAGVGIAVKNGKEQVKSAARFVTAAPAADGAVAEALAALSLV
jgi:Cof subfamily protein (haloacid dehalogenase superfamily)